MTHLTHLGNSCTMYAMDDKADRMLRVSLRNMPSDLWKRLRHLAIERSVSVGHIIEEALERYLKTEEK